MRSPRRSWRWILVFVATGALWGPVFLQDRIIPSSSASTGTVREVGAANTSVMLITSPSPSACPQASGRKVWVGGKKLVSGLMLDSGCTALTMDAEHVEDIAVDNDRSVVWVSTRRAVIQYDFFGRERFRHTFKSGSHQNEDGHEPNRSDQSPHGGGKGEPADGIDDDDAGHDEGGHGRVRLALDPASGSLWAGADHGLIKLSGDGQILAEMRCPGPVADVSVDIADGTCWVGAGDQIWKYSSDGDSLASYTLGKKDKIVALAADPRDHHLWIGSSKNIIKVDGQGIEILRIPFMDRIRDLAVDITTRALWVVTDEAVHHYDREGRPLIRNPLCAENEENDDAERTAHHSGQDRDGMAGHSLEQHGGDDQDRHGSSGSHDDRDGCRSDHGEDGDRDASFCAGGLIALAVDSADNTCWVAGRNSLWKISWTGEQLLSLKGLRKIEAIDIGMPKIGITISAPREGDIFVDEPLTAVTGTVSDPAAKILVLGREAAVAGLAFEAVDVLLSEGTNTITAVATNIAGQTASDSVRVQYQPQGAPGFYICPEPYWEQWPQPPAPGCAQLALLNQWNYSRAYLFGHVEETTSSVTVDGVALPSGVEIYNQGRITRGWWSGTFFWVLMMLGGPDGEYEVTASAANGQGAIKTAVVTILKDTLPPHIIISSPTRGTITSGSTITVSGTVDDPAAMVAIGWGGQDIPVVNGMFNATYDLEIWDGPQELFAIATDPAMNTGYASVQVIRDSTPPQLNIIAPAEGAIVSTPTVSISGTMADATPENIMASINGGKPQPLMLNGTAVSGQVALASGSNTIHIEARDKAGNSATLVRSIVMDNELPVVAIDPALSSASLSGKTTVAVTASDGISGVQSVALFIDDRLQGIRSQGPYTFTIDTLRLAAGSHTILVRAIDKAGNTGEAWTSVTVQKQLGIEILSPRDGGVVPGSMVIVQGKYDPFANREAGITINGIPAHQSGLDFAALIPLQAGQNRITAIISNEYGVSEQVSVMVSAGSLQEPVRMTANPGSGIPMPKPDGSMLFETRLQAEASLTGLPVNYAWDLNGDGFADQQGALLTAATASFTAPGLNYPSVTVTDSLGNTATAMTVVNVIDRTAIDALLRAKWEEMKRSLADRDIEGALGQFIPGSQERYRNIFLTLNDVLPQMVQEMRTIQPVYLREGMAKYRIRRSEMVGGAITELTYYIYFTPDKNGIWKIAYF